MGLVVIRLEWVISLQKDSINSLGKPWRPHSLMDVKMCTLARTGESLGLLGTTR
jgi:hypothetical protein